MLGYHPNELTGGARGTLCWVITGLSWWAQRGARVSFCSVITPTSKCPLFFFFFSLFIDVLYFYNIFFCVMRLYEFELFCALIRLLQVILVDCIMFLILRFLLLLFLLSLVCLIFTQCPLFYYSFQFFLRHEKFELFAHLSFCFK